MKTWKKILLIGGFVVIVSIAFVVRFVVYKPHPDYLKMKPERVVVARNLFDEYSTNSKNADSLYLGRMIEIKGYYHSVENTDSQLVVVFAFRQGDFGDEGIRCSMLPGSVKFPKISADSAFIQLKGICKGYNQTDVILEKCSLLP